MHGFIQSLQSRARETARKRCSLCRCFEAFQEIVNFLEPHVQNTGDSAFAWNSTRNEAAVFLSRDVGKKFTLSNCFLYKIIRQPRGYTPVYDEYKAMFAGCDAFNQKLHNNTFPYRLPSDTNMAQDKNIWNYLFTSCLVSSWNLWKAVLRNRDNECQLPSFTEFCNSLARGMIKKMCFH